MGRLIVIVSRPVGIGGDRFASSQQTKQLIDRSATRI